MNVVFVYEEIKKIYQSKYMFIVSIIITLSVLIPAIFLYNENLDQPIVFYSFNIYSENMRLFWPIVSITLYSWIIGHEFSNKSVYLILKSRLDWSCFIAGKFLSVTISLGTIFITINIVYLIFLILTTDINNIFINFMNINFSEFLLNWLVVTLMSLLFLYCIGAFSILVTLITKNWVFSLVIMIIMILLLPNLQLPINLLDFTLLKGFYIPQLLYSSDLDFIYLFRNMLVYVAYIIIFLLISFKMKKIILK